MLIIILYFITAILGLLCVAIILKNQDEYNQTYINKYLLLGFSIVSFRFFILGILTANPELNKLYYTGILDTVLMMTLPCFYLYFIDLMKQAKFDILNLYHFIVPFLSAAMLFIFNYVDIENKLIIKKIFLLISLIVAITYMVLGHRLLNRHIWNREVDINSVQKQNLLIKKWTKFLSYSFILIYFLRIVPGIIAYLSGTQNNFLWLTTPFWILIFLFLLTTPEILYGFNFLNNTIEKEVNKVVLNSVWNINRLKEQIDSEKDKKLEEKIKPSILEYIHKIEELSFHSLAFRNPELTITDIANSLNIPSSHINFIFKYHCSESFSDYKKIVRIHDATQLLKEGYLKNNKMETLSELVGFSSYSTFYIAFKNITGVTMQEYVKRF